MGKWATYRKRGGSTGSTVALTSPPVPSLYIEGGLIKQSARGGDDTGGQIRLQQSDDGNDPWYQVDSGAWVATKTWGTVVQYFGYWLRCYEIGNGIAYAGNSPYSAVLPVP
jgi:hypothetical protein